MRQDRYSILSADELGSLGSTVELCTRLGFSPRLLLGEVTGQSVYWSPSHSLTGPIGIRSCFRAASNGSKHGCGIAASLRVVSGLRSFNGVGLFITTCSCGSRSVCAFRSRTSANGGLGAQPTSKSPDLRWLTLPATQARSDRSNLTHSLQGVAFSGTSGLALRNAFSELGGFALSGFGD